MRRIALSLLVLMCALKMGHAADVEAVVVGEIEVPVATPQGCTRISKAEAKTLSLSMMSITGHTLAYFLTEADAKLLQNGQDPLLDRFILLRIPGNVQFGLVGDPQFADFVGRVKSARQKTLAEVVARIPDDIDTTNRTLTATFDLAKVNPSKDPLFHIPFAPHLESDRAFGHVTLTQDILGEKIFAQSSTFVNASGKFLELFTVSKEEDTAWSMATSTSWAREMVKLNSGPPPTKTPSIRGFWPRYKWPVIGFLFVLVTSVIGRILR